MNRFWQYARCAVLSLIGTAFVLVLINHVLNHFGGSLNSGHVIAGLIIGPLFCLCLVGDQTAGDNVSCPRVTHHDDGRATYHYPDGTRIHTRDGALDSWEIPGPIDDGSIKFN